MTKLEQRYLSLILSVKKCISCANINTTFIKPTTKGKSQWLKKIEICSQTETDLISEKVFHSDIVGIHFCGLRARAICAPTHIHTHTGNIT